MIRTRFAERVGLLLAIAALGPTSLAAQNPNSGIAPQQQVGPNERRAQLEQQLRERTGEVVKRRLGLTDEQMTKLQSTNRDFEQQRMDLMMRERETRQALRAQMMSGDSANQSKVGQLLDQSIQLQRQRLDLLQNEQRELGRFLTPVQRARYFGIQNELRKRAQAVRAGQMPGRRMAPLRPPMAGGLKR